MTLWAIPIGTKVAICKADTCRKQIYWVRTGRGSFMPVDANIEGGKKPTRRLPGQGVPHWATCPEAKAFRDSE